MEYATISFPIFGDGFVLNLPRYFTVFGYNIYIYGLFVTAGFVLATLYLLKRSAQLGLTKDNILDLVIMAVPCGLVGARLYYILFNASYYFGPGKWQNIIMLREGGLAVYGGIIGSAIAFIIYSRVKKIKLSKLLDAAGFGLFIGQAVGRWGNFFNREAYGVETTMPWRMGLTTGAVTIYVHPTFLYESLWNIVGFILLHIFSKKCRKRYNGEYFLLYVAWYGLGRYMIEGLRTDSLFIPGTDIRVSQLLAAISFAVAVVLLIRNHFRGIAVPKAVFAEKAQENIERDLTGNTVENIGENVAEDACENIYEHTEIGETGEIGETTENEETGETTESEENGDIGETTENEETGNIGETTESEENGDIGETTENDENAKQADVAAGSATEDKETD